MASATAAQEAEEPPSPPPAREAPTSILPDIFGPAPPPPPRPVPEQRPALAEPGEAALPGLPAPPAGTVPSRAPAPAEQAARPAELPGPTRPAASAGLVTEATIGFPRGIFAGSDGRFLAGLLVRLEGPLASRWGQIAVQRLLLTEADPPPGIDPGDWLAARTRALVAIGAAAEAHRMVMRVRRADYSPRLYGAAAHAALAAGDPLGLCPIAADGRAASDDNPAFVLADGYCSAIAGDPFSANQLFEEARRRRIADPFDLQLAERIAALGGTRSAGNPVW
ncbi:MAG: hypothetical protein SNJ63_04505, partial [Sphingomonadaceae bacterium]